MVYSDTTSKNGILQMIEQTLALGDGGITGNTTRKAYFTMLVNDFYRLAAFLAWKVDKTWVFDDINYSTFPEATTTLVDNQRDYSLPATALKVRQVEVLDKTGQYFSLQYIKEEDELLLSDKEQEQKSIPWGYRLVANSLILYPAPDATMITVTNGLRVTIDREVDEFLVSDTTATAGITATLTPILYYGPSYVYSSTNGMDAVRILCEKMLGKLPGLVDIVQDYYSNRNEKTQVIKRKHQSYK